MANQLTPEFERVAALVEEQPTEVSQAFQFCITVAMEEEGAAKLINTAQVDGRTWYSYETVAGEVFSVVRPEIGAEVEREVREWLVRPGPRTPRNHTKFTNPFSRPLQSKGPL